MNMVATTGRIFLGVACAAAGLRQLISLTFVRLVPALPEWMPWHAFWAGVSGAVLAVAGGAILLNRRTSLAAAVVAWSLVLVILFRYVPRVAIDPWSGFMWTNPCKALALLGGALVLAADERSRWSGAARVSCQLALAVFLGLCGAQHFVYETFVDTLVPSWMPSSPRFWTWFTGCALLAGGVGMMVPKTARLAALLSALMVFLWILMLHLPRAVALRSAFEFDGVFEALGISGVALLVAATVGRSASRV